MPKKILLVDDEPLILKGLKYSLEQDGFITHFLLTPICQSGQTYDRNRSISVTVRSGCRARLIP